MASLVTATETVAAGSQFVGTEFAVSPSRRGVVLWLYEVDIQMGSESKTWTLQKVLKNGSIVVLQQSRDLVSGAPGATTDSSVIISGPDILTLLEPGEQIQLVTSGATSTMVCKLYLVEGTIEELVLTSKR